MQKVQIISIYNDKFEISSSRICNKDGLHICGKHYLGVLDVKLDLVARGRALCVERTPLRIVYRNAAFQIVGLDDAIIEFTGSSLITIALNMKPINQISRSVKDALSTNDSIIV